MKTSLLSAMACVFACGGRMTSYPDRAPSGDGDDAQGGAVAVDTSGADSPPMGGSSSSSGSRGGSSAGSASAAASPGTGGHAHAGTGGATTAGTGAVIGGAGGQSWLDEFAGAPSQAGEGGHAGAPQLPTQAQACRVECRTFFNGHPGLCPGTPVDERNCNLGCAGYDYSDSAINELFLTYTRCVAAELTSAGDYECGEQSGVGATVTPMWPIAGGPCEADLCRWTCADQTFVDFDVFVRCGC